MARLVNLATVLVVIFAISGTGMRVLESLEWKLMFFPTSAISLTLGDLGAKYEDIYFPTTDGEQLNGWFVPAPTGSAGEPAPTVLWFHGNGGNLGNRASDVLWLNRRLNTNVFIFDYRGYGRSTGSPTEQGVYLDSRAALTYLLGRDDVDQGKIVFLGRSLGCAVAVELASAVSAHNFPAGLILISPFTHTKDMARVHNRLNPFRFLVPNRFNSLERITGVPGPFLIIHGDRDRTVPLKQGQQLYAAAAEPKTFHLWSGADHNDDLGIGHERLWKELGSFMASLSERAKG